MLRSCALPDGRSEKSTRRRVDLRGVREVMNYELHPLCTLFPRLSGAEFDALREDIKTNGLRAPIVLHEGMILDGGNRYRACLEAGIDPEFITFDGGNLVAFVLSANLHRRHMSAGQQAAIVASAQDWAKAQGSGRPESGQDCPLSTTKERAAASGAHINTQKMADKVAKADPDLAKKVAHGEVSLPALFHRTIKTRHAGGSACDWLTIPLLDFARPGPCWCFQRGMHKRL